jgi:starch-binding outer membrane protein, SusD/RagB family
MKTQYRIPVIFMLLILGITSCNEKEFLDEVPLDFNSPENTFNTISGFEATLADLYAKEREIYYGGSDVTFSLMYGTDMYMHARGVGDGSTEKMSNLTNAIQPGVNAMKVYWNANYKIISVANLIIGNASKSTLPQADLKRLTAEAKLFRAKAYRDLVYLYGDVPLITEPVTAARFDYVRAPKNDVLNQMVLDLTDASNDLSAITAVADGRVSKPIAYHYLAETLLSLGRKDEALIAANAAISSPGVNLMTARFGRRTSIFGKDVFWDLFQKGNQNRASGNKEALWVAQIQEDALGGLVVTSRIASANSYERNHVPAVWSISKTTAPNGSFQGRKSDDNVGMYGVSFLQPTPYLNNTNPPAVSGTTPGVWPANYAGDMRCNNNNFIKDCKYDNPTSALFGQSILAPGNRPTNWGITSEADLSKPIANQSWRWYPWFIKATTPGDHPIALLDPTHITGWNQANGGATYHDQYILRLAETYLLRAEIHAALGNNALALADINTVRSRAGATPFAGTVTIDYILDERARELALEEQRTITLRRLGVYVNRVKAGNPMSAPTAVPVKHELWPIPQDAINANRDAVMPQNPLYN